jgi:hypothetical protein
MSVAANGIVIEQEQILTTHNLAVFYQGLGLSEVLAPQLGVMAQRCLRFVFRRIQMQVPSWHARLLSIKDSGYAFRQRWQDSSRFLRVGPYPSGATWSNLEGHARRLLGWATSKHWLS